MIVPSSSMTSTASPIVSKASARRASRVSPEGGLRTPSLGTGILESITRLSGGTGFGYDPSTVPDRDIPNVKLVSDLYRPGHDVEPYDVLRTLTRRFELQMRARGSRDLPIRITAEVEGPEQPHV